MDQTPLKKVKTKILIFNVHGCTLGIEMSDD